MYVGIKKAGRLVMLLFWGVLIKKETIIFRSLPQEL